MGKRKHFIGDFERLRAVLSALNGKPKTISRIAIETRTVIPIMRPHLDVLVKKQCIEILAPTKKHHMGIGKTSQRQLYCLTDKGRDFLATLNSVAGEVMEIMQ